MVNIRRFLLLVAVLAALIISGQPFTAAHASEMGCKIVLCLSNPGGSRQFQECHEPMNVLQRCIRRHKPWPKCNEAQAQYGVEEFQSCEESYGKDYRLRTTYSSEYDFSGGNVCSKVIRYDYGWDGISVPIYDDQPLVARKDPYYMDINGTRYWFNLDD
jgi:hypothetical protein